MNRKLADEAGSRLLNLILDALSNVRFGSVEITVHDGRVTQIERRERTRTTGLGSELSMQGLHDFDHSDSTRP